LTHHTFKVICCLFSPYIFCLLWDQSITFRILLLSNLNIKICTWFCPFLYMLGNVHRTFLICQLQCTFEQTKYGSSFLYYLHIFLSHQLQHFKSAILSSTRFLAHQCRPCSDFFKSSVLAHPYHTGKNRKSKFTINVFFQASSYRFFPFSNCFKISFLFSLWLCFKDLWGRWTTHFLILLEQIKKM
jgi:hypothetical protein